MKKLILLCLAVSVYAWDCSWVEKKSVYTDEELCRRATAYETTDRMDKFRIKLGVGFSQLDDKSKSETSKVLLENAEQCYQTCLAKVSKSKI